MVKGRIRHILGISGGKDSTALAILLHNKVPNLEYFFCDTHKELPETYEYLNRIETRLGIKIHRLSAHKGFDEWLELHGGFLPSARARWCTVKMKIQPLQQFVGLDVAYSYVGIRADENRLGYVGVNNSIHPVYVYKERDFISRNLGKTVYNQKDTLEVFRKMGIDLPIKGLGYDLEDIKDIIADSGLGMPKYYSWRSRSGCFFCFFQRKYEWVMLAEKHPILFDEACRYEKDLSNGNRFTWCERESLKELLKRKDEIIANHKRDLSRKKKEVPNKPLVEVLGALDEEEYQKPCLICTL